MKPKKTSTVATSAVTPAVASTAATPVVTPVVPATTSPSLTGGASITLAPVLTKAERRKLLNRSERVPDELVQLLIELSDQGGGKILGMSFDAAAARNTLAQASATQTQISVGKQTLQRTEDDMIQKRATVADPSFAIYTALRRLVNTKAGNALLPAYTQMQAIVKNRPRRVRSKKGGTKGADAEGGTTSASAPVVSVVPPAVTVQSVPMAASVAASPGH